MENDILEQQEVTPDIENSVDKQEEETPDIFDFQTVLPRLTKLIGDWSAEISETDRRRKMRKLDVDLDSLRQEGKLKADEALIPIRVIDTNIKQEQPPFNSYLTQSRRIAIFEPVNKRKGDIDTQELEIEFTKGMTYVGWQRPFFKAVDGSQLHGWDWVEIERDETKPLGVNINFLGHENVIFPVDAKEFEACEIVIVGYDFTTLKVQKFIDKKYFDATEGAKIIAEYKDKASQENATFKLYKKFCKYKDQVFVSWFSDKHCDDWLRTPEPLFLGRRRKETKMQTVPVPMPDVMGGFGQTIPMMQPVEEWVDITETIYSLKRLPYQETEESEITETKGRAWLDGPKQEAQTCLWSNFVNSSGRASSVYCSPKQGAGAGTPKRLDIVLEAGAVYSEPMEFWSPPMLDFNVIRAAQALDTQTQVETGRVAFAAINNQDSRKTAKEIGAAQTQNQLLNSVQVTLFSIFLCEVWNHVWSIVQSLALQGVIPFLVIGENPDGTFLNDEEKLSVDYKLQPSGDVDVIERAENEQKRQLAWPLITSMPTLLNNPLAIKFAKDTIEEMFPEDSAEYMKMIDQMAMQGNIVMMLMQILQTSAETGQPVTPEQFQQIVQATAAASGQGGQPQGGQQPSPQPPQQSQSGSSSGQGQVQQPTQQTQ
jgi:hypothetical protein